MKGGGTTIDIQAWAALEKGAPLVPHQLRFGEISPRDVEIEVECCAICHSDLHLLDNDWGNAVYPLVPGHEIVGRVRAVGAEAARDPAMRVGARVGLGWQAGACWSCSACQGGNEHLCYRGKVRTCVGRPGGLAEAVRADHRFVFPIPDRLSSAEAAPLLCAGATVFSPLERLVTRPGMRLGVIGLGGLGHLAVQFGRAMGCEVTAFDPVAAKAEEAAKLGAIRFAPADTSQLKDLRGSQDILLSTTHVQLDWDGWMRVLDLGGTLCLTGIPPARVDLNAGHLLDGQKALTGSVIAHPRTIRAMLAFSAEHGVRPWIETLPWGEANEAVAKLRAGKARYRMVLARSRT